MDDPKLPDPLKDIAIDSASETSKPDGFPTPEQLPTSQQTEETNNPVMSPGSIAKINLLPTNEDVKEIPELPTGPIVQPKTDTPEEFAKPFTISSVNNPPQTEAPSVANLPPNHATPSPPAPAEPPPVPPVPKHNKFSARGLSFLAVILLLLTLPVAVYFLSQRKQVADLRKRADLIPPCLECVSGYCKSNSSNDNLYGGGYTASCDSTINSCTSANTACSVDKACKICAGSGINSCVPSGVTNCNPQLNKCNGDQECPGATSSCTQTCADVGAECGTVSNCNCGKCDTGYYCNNQHECNKNNTTPNDTCTSEKIKECESNFTYCVPNPSGGACASLPTDTPSQLSCTQICANAGAECGTVSNCPCGGNNGKCPAGQSCNNQRECIQNNIGPTETPVPTPYCLDEIKTICGSRGCIPDSNGGFCGPTPNQTSTPTPVTVSSSVSCTHDVNGNTSGVCVNSPVGAKCVKSGTNGTCQITKSGYSAGVGYVYCDCQVSSTPVDLLINPCIRPDCDTVNFKPGHEVCIEQWKRPDGTLYEKPGVDTGKLCGGATPTNPPGPTNPPAGPQCLKIFVYKNGVAIDPNSPNILKTGDAVEFAVNSNSATKARIKINGGDWTETSTKNTEGYYTLGYTIPNNVTTFTVDAEVPNGGVWQ